MKNPLRISMISRFSVQEALRALQNNLVVAGNLPRVLRVRRRGFRSDVRRGSAVRHAGKTWNVVRRSNWHLWLCEHVDMSAKSHVWVKLPARYEAHS